MIMQEIYDKENILRLTYTKSYTSVTLCEIKTKGLFLY